MYKTKWMVQINYFLKCQILAKTKNLSIKISTYAKKNVFFEFNTEILKKVSSP